MIPSFVGQERWKSWQGAAYIIPSFVALDEMKELESGGRNNQALSGKRNERVGKLRHE